MRPWKDKGSIDPNPIGLGTEAVSALLPELDAHQASLFVLFHQYQKHHWLVEGPEFRDLHLFLQQAYEKVHEEVDAIAERMTALGGIPTAHPAELARLAYVEHEPEGAFRVRAMLERDREHEGRIAERLRKTIALAARLGDYGTEHLLKEVLVEVEDRAHHLDHFLGADSLEPGWTADERAGAAATARGR